MNALSRRLTSLLPPIVFGVLFLGAWEAFVVWRDVKPFVLVKPSQVWSAGLDNLQRIADAMEVTGGNALIGLIVGTTVGCLVALLASGVRWVRCRLRLSTIKGRHRDDASMTPAAMLVR